MSVPLYQVDAFTSRPYAGNPAAVCLLEADRPEEWMQAVAREMNLSETAFVYPGTTRRRLRWFTPTTEANLCGHATLTAAHVLWGAEDLSSDDQVVFDTLAGRLAVGREEDVYVMNFPAEPADSAAPPEGMLASLGLEEDEVVWVGRNPRDYLVQVASPQRVRTLAPDMASLRTVETRGVMVTAEGAGEEHDFVSRFFAPAAGIDEDPVTGSAHCCLGPFWQQRLGKDELWARQVSPRGGELRVRPRDDRVDLLGRAVTIMKGQLEPE